MYWVEREYCEPYSHLTWAGKLLLNPVELNQITSRMFYYILYIMGFKVMRLTGITVEQSFPLHPLT